MLVFVVIAVAVLAAYIQALGGPLLWDDRLLILDAPLVQGDASIGDYLSRPFWSGEGAQPASVSYYRPLVTLSFAFDQRLHGTNTAGYHLTNIAAHIAASLALFALLKRHGIRPWTAATLAVAWALLPRLAEAGAWISGRADALAGAFSLCALVVWDRSLLRRALAAGLFALALLAKESAVAVVAAVALSEWVADSRGTFKERYGRTVMRMMPLVVVVAAYLSVRFMLGFEPRARKLSGIEHVRTVFEALATYAWMLVDVFRPRAVIGRVGALSWPWTVAGVLVLVASAALFQRYRARIGVAQAVGLGLLAGALLPVLHLVPLPLRTLVADRFLYLPAAGVTLMAAAAVDRWLVASRGARIAALATVVALFVTTTKRVAVWSDEVEFWSTTYLQAPRTNHLAALELMGVFYRGGRYEEALELTERALRYDDPNRRDALYNMAVCASRLGRHDLALTKLIESGGGRLTADEVVLASVIQIQAGEVDAARKRLEELARKGNENAKVLLARTPAYALAHRELPTLSVDDDPVKVARLETLIGAHARAIKAWTVVARSPTADRAALLEGLGYLVQTGDAAAISAVARAHVGRFGPLPPALEAIVELRLSEIERLVATARRLGLAQRPAAGMTASRGG